MEVNFSSNVLFFRSLGVFKCSPIFDVSCSFVTTVELISVGHLIFYIRGDEGTRADFES